MNNFSPNMLKTFDDCQTKFELKYIQKLSVPQESKFFEKGKKIHALANYYLRGENIEKMENSLTADEKQAWETLKSSKYFALHPVNTEYNLSCKIGDFWIGGRLDALMSQTDSTASTDPPQPSCDFFILDYKTGNIPPTPEQDFQTIVYLLCADKFLHHKKIDYKSLQFVYLGLKKEVEKSIMLDDKTKTQYENKIVETCKKIELAISSTVFSKNVERCKNCEYNKFCNN